ncbi:hypothetical protein P280DRAFT_536418 [Massarina eburnea CBS 473.64]|uniref:Uncharacterized protein n=1 Tax=Massarina eburnea CBS 473.64 TaxID=1395130 RepID=A0A6A6RII3_9PLEO|nr:hypothetical protein P280DRAFT_536418 [Massarina eburnea CBS 473.64]
MAGILCCDHAKSYEKQRKSPEKRKFREFSYWIWMEWLNLGHLDEVKWEEFTIGTTAISVTRFGDAVGSMRCFVRCEHQCYRDVEFREVSEQLLVDADYRKIDGYKKYKCRKHEDRFFEVNVYERDPESTYFERNVVLF